MKLKFLVYFSFLISACSTSTHNFNWRNFIIVSISQDTINSGEGISVKFVVDSTYYKYLNSPPLYVYYDDTVKITKRQNSFVIQEIVGIQSDSLIKRNIPLGILLNCENKQIPGDTVLNYFVTNVENSRRSEGQLIDGQKNGLWKFYYDNNKLKIWEISNWKDNLKHGKTEHYFKNGKISNIFYFKEGVPTGEWKTFGTSGKLHLIQIFKDGKQIESKSM